MIISNAISIMVTLLHQNLSSGVNILSTILTLQLFNHIHCQYWLIDGSLGHYLSISCDISGFKGCNRPNLCDWTVVQRQKFVMTDRSFRTFSILSIPVAFAAATSNNPDGGRLALCHPFPPCSRPAFRGKMEN